MATGNYPLPEFLNIEGVRQGTASAGIKSRHDDVTIFEMQPDASVAAVFTKNAFCAAPVILAKEAIKKAMPQYLLINTGNANAGNGENGLVSAQACVDALAEKVHIDSSRILPFSTGVIGEPLPHEKIIASLNEAIDDLSENHWHKAASAILTTDTRPKGVSRSIAIGDGIVNLSGICKGSGMIKPNMATMLAFVAMDLKITQSDLQQLLNKVNQKSFNRITVDGDTSTNDAVVLIATGRGSIDFNLLSDDQKEVFEAWLLDTFVALAQLIIRDGEGATKFIEVKVDGGRDEQECEELAFAIAHSPLVKTALFASDPNWGRILAVVGRAGLHDLAIEAVEIFINGQPLVQGGAKVNSFTEAVGVKLFQQEEIQIHIGLNRGEAEASIWTTDLSFDYIKINAEYRT